MLLMKRFVILLLAAALAAGERTTEPTGLETDRFIDAVVMLRRAAIDLRHDPAAYEVHKEQLLRDAGLTEDELRRYVERHGTDLDHMADVWRAINARMSQNEAVAQ
jgi:hypothetical protein